MRFRTLSCIVTAAVCAALVTACVRDFNNPADPANNGGFFGGIDPKIAGVWNEVSPNNDVGALVCMEDSFVCRPVELQYSGPVSPVNARGGQIFAYYPYAATAAYFLDYKLSVAGDTLFMAHMDLTNSLPYFIDPLTGAGYTTFVRPR